MSSCPRSPDGPRCRLSAAGHRELTLRYKLHKRIGKWGALHTADVYERDLIWHGVKGNLHEIVARAGEPIPLPRFWGSA